MLLIFLITLIFFIHCSISIRTTDFCKSLPKIELHAHLHGSIRPSTMIDLAQPYPSLAYEMNTVLNGSRNLDKCFSIFRILHHLVSSKAILTRIINEVIDDYIKDNVIYLELRSTPRDLPDGTTKIEYLQTILNIINKYNENNNIVIKLIVSIDRSKDIKEAEEILDIVQSLLEYNNDIIGLDFSGNPNQNSFRQYSTIFQKARESGLYITIHSSELPSELVIDSKETDFILDFEPDRIGHALYLKPHHIDRLLESSSFRPSIEICPTSNYFTMNLNSFEDHPTFLTWISNGYPVSINTDDSGVFDTNLSQEYQLIQNTYSLSNQQMIQLAESTINQIFAKNLINKVKKLFLLKLNDVDSSSRSIYVQSHNMELL